MSLPEAMRLELPILLELKSTGGRDLPRYLYPRLAKYFPQLAEQEVKQKTSAGRSHWNLLVQRAAGNLIAQGELKRTQTGWEITPRGIVRVAAEELQITRLMPNAETQSRTLTHKEAQMMLIEIGGWLGRYAEAEFEHYDVIWRDSIAAPRLSHVFEVQISGSVDSALTRLKHAYDAQRSQLFLVIADERDVRFAGKRLTGSFHEILELVTIIGTGELQKLFAALKTEQQLLQKLTQAR